MKQKFIFISLLFFSLAFSQTHRFIYELEIRKQDDVNQIKMVLDIDQNFVKFYDYNFLEVDTHRKSSGENRKTNSESDQLVIREINSFKNTSLHSFGYDYFAISSTDKIAWNLENETKKNQNYTLQKATGQFGGRMWTAWFSNEIPFPEGPFKFKGLSGLIFEIYDTENRFHYNLVEIINLPETFDTKEFVETYYGKKPILIKLKQLHQLKLNYYHNIVEDLNNFREKGGSISSNDELDSKEKILQEKKSIQQSIKKYYLPLEKDKAINYPD